MDSEFKSLLFNTMSIIENSPFSVETPVIPLAAHSTNSQANSIHHMGAAALRVGIEGILHDVAT